MSVLPSYPLAPLPAALAPTAWQQSAACRFEDRDLFFPPEEERGRYGAFREAAAKQICARCPVAGECLTHALGADERYGVWGGLSAEERTRLRRARRTRKPNRPHRDHSPNLYHIRLPTGDASCRLDHCRSGRRPLHDQREAVGRQKHR